MAQTIEIDLNDPQIHEVVGAIMPDGMTVIFKCAKCPYISILNRFTGERKTTGNDGGFLHAGSAAPIGRFDLNEN